MVRNARRCRRDDRGNRYNDDREAVIYKMKNGTDGTCVGMLSYHL
jgi:hypothetical protein